MGHAEQQLAHERAHRTKPLACCCSQGKRDGTTRDEAFAWESREFLRKKLVGQVRAEAAAAVVLLFACTWLVWPMYGQVRDNIGLNIDSLHCLLSAAGVCVQG